MFDAIAARKLCAQCAVSANFARETAPHALFVVLKVKGRIDTI